uniref:Wolframin cysteine-rich domain-containing protein n=1 Tax=Romanomermis culicivorax TaxID=13658 RepID=A0A915KXQ0_ROMCU
MNEENLSSMGGVLVTEIWDHKFYTASVTTISPNSDLISKISESRLCTSSKSSKEYGPKLSLRSFWNEGFAESLNDLRIRQNRSRSNLAYNGNDDDEQQQETRDDLGKSAAADYSKFAKIAHYFSCFEDLDSDTFTRLIGSASLKNNVQNMADYFFDHLQEEWGNFFETIIPLRQMHTMLLISVFQLVSIHFLTSFLPTFTLYSSFFFAIYFTLKICHRYHSVNDIMAWNKLLIIFAAEIEQTRGSVYPRKGRLTPRRTYSISQESNDDARSTCRDKVLNCRPMYVSLIASLTLFIFSLSYRNSGQQKDIPSNIFSLFAISILCQIVTVSTVMANNEHRFLNKLWIFGHVWIVLPQILRKLGFESFAFWTNIHFSILDGALVYDLNLFSLCFLFSALLYLLYVASNFTAIDFYYTICPHLLGFLWSLLTLTLFQFTEFNSLQKIDIALTLSLVCLLILPKTGLFIYLAILVSDHWHFVGLLKILFTTLIILLPMISTKFFTKLLRSLSVKFSSGDVSEPIQPIQNRQNTATTGIGTMSTIFYVLMILILIFGFFYKIERSHFENNSIPKLNWTLFERYCLRFDDFSRESLIREYSSFEPVFSQYHFMWKTVRVTSRKLPHSWLWSYSNRPPLTREIFCRSIKGSALTGVGRVKTIKIRQVDNFFQKIFEYLPDFLDEWLTCFYGHSLTDSSSEPENKSLRPFVVRNCTLDHHNIYTFDIVIELSNKSEK